MIVKKFTLLLAGSLASALAGPTPQKVNPELELIITSPRVVTSPLATYPGSLSFGRLMETNFGKELAPSVVRSWILSYSMPTKVAGQTIEPREETFKNIIQPWLKKDGFTGKHLLDWNPNLANAPLKLLSVVNRQDIAIATGIAPNSDITTQTPPSPLLKAALSEEEKARVEGLSGVGPSHYYGGHSGTGGEIRFIYCLTDQNGTPLEGGMTVILEYDQMNLYRATNKEPATAKETAHHIATRWNALADHQELNTDYLADLETLVKQATTPIPLPPQNQRSSSRLIIGDIVSASPLMRIRTNDSALGKGREFRQFDSTGKTVIPTLLSASLADAFCDPKTPESRALAKYLASYKTLPFKIYVDGKMTSTSTASSLTLPGEEENTAWNIKFISSESRRHLSLNSCMGCHGNETKSDGFHIAPPSLPSLPSLLSDFLSDSSKRTNTRDPHSQSNYKQPGELARRVRIHKALINPGILKLNRFARLAIDGKNTAH